MSASSDEQKECGRILSDYATDMTAPNPIDTAIALANAGFGTEAGVILSCIFSSGLKVHPLPRGFTTMAIYKYKPKNKDDEGIDEVSNDDILVVLGTDITRPPPPGTAPIVAAYCYRLRYASFGKISHMYPCTYEELKKYGDKAFEEFNKALNKYYNTALGVTQGGAQGSAQQADTVQQSAPPRRIGSRRRRAEEEEMTEEVEEPEDEEGVNEGEQ